MDIGKFNQVYRESRNGANHMVRHWAVRNFVYSDGVHDLAEIGCHWLVDMIATETRDYLLSSGGRMGQIDVLVRDTSAELKLTFEDDGPVIWSRHVEFTTLPEGTWTFMIQYDGSLISLILPTEY